MLAQQVADARTVTRSDPRVVHADLVEDDERRVVLDPRSRGELRGSGSRFPPEPHGSSEPSPIRSSKRPSFSTSSRRRKTVAAFARFQRLSSVSSVTSVFHEADERPRATPAVRRRRPARVARGAARAHARAGRRVAQSSSGNATTSGCEAAEPALRARESPGGTRAWAMSRPGCAASIPSRRSSAFWSTATNARGRRVLRSSESSSRPSSSTAHRRDDEVERREPRGTRRGLRDAVPTAPLVSVSSPSTTASRTSARRSRASSDRRSPISS